ncbi:MAG: MarR family transcriptional regulator [Kouleothrix sp.]|nr:MarR family transcriptional regulator [Kouleothrix sp.]
MDRDADQALETTKELLAVLPLLNRIVAAEVRREAGEETTMPQFRVLAHLAAEPLTLSLLAKKRRVSLQAMSELVQALVARGWIVRVPDQQDRRQALLQLTDHGRSHYERAQAQMLQRLAPLLAQLRADELAAVQLALPALRRVLIQEEHDASDERKTTAEPAG